MDSQRKRCSWRSIIDENTSKERNKHGTQPIDPKPQDEAIKLVKNTTDKLLSIHCSSSPNGHWIAHRLGVISINEIRKSGQRISGVTCKWRETAWSKERTLLCDKIAPVRERNSLEGRKLVAAYQNLSAQHISWTVFPSTPKLFQRVLSYNRKWSHCSVF